MAGRRDATAGRNLSGRADGRARRAFVWIAALGLVLAAGLTGAWYYLAGQLDTQVARALETARQRGTEIDCPGREVFGYPFRLGLRCEALTIDARNDGLRASAGQLRTAAQIYRPNRVVAELDSPLLVEAAEAPPLDVRWQLLQASGTFWTEGLDHFALVADAPVVSLAQPAGARLAIVEAARSEFHARRRDGDLDLAWSSREAKIVAPNAPTLPVFDASTDFSIGGAAEWLTGRVAGETPGEALAGRPIALRSLKVDMPEADAELSGDFSFGADGTLTGTFDLAVSQPEKVAELVGEAVPQLSSVASSLASAVSFLGRRENGRSVISFTARDGRLSAGIIPLGRIPPLR